MGDSTLTVVRGTIAGNNRLARAAAFTPISPGTGAASFTDVEIVDNTAGDGGGLRYVGRQLRMADSNVRRNRALGGAGGGIAAQSLDIGIFGGAIEDNATDFRTIEPGIEVAGPGAGAWLQPHPTLPASSSRIDVAGVVFQRNVSELVAGGLAAKAAQITVRDASFVSNVADANGGGLYLEPVGSARVANLERVNVVDNRGGGLYATLSVIAVDSVFAGKRSGQPRRRHLFYGVGQSHSHHRSRKSNHRG